jgi:hypothetical protein
LAQSKAKLCKKLIITLVFEKNDNFFAENCRKSQKIVIITSTPASEHEAGFLSEKFPYVPRFGNYKSWTVSKKTPKKLRTRNDIALTVSDVKFGKLVA